MKISPFLSAALLLMFLLTACQESGNTEETTDSMHETQETPRTERPQSIELPPSSTPLRTNEAPKAGVHGDAGLEGKRWILTELMGEPAEDPKDARKVNYIQFHTEGRRIHAYAGCNQMSGTYEIAEGRRIEFSEIIATRMACENMKPEEQMKEVLKVADNYAISDGILSLNVGKRAPLARFKQE